MTTDFRPQALLNNSEETRKNKMGLQKKLSSNEVMALARKVKKWDLLSTPRQDTPNYFSFIGYMKETKTTVVLSWHSDFFYDYGDFQRYSLVINKDGENVQECKSGCFGKIKRFYDDVLSVHVFGKTDKELRLSYRKK